jgi:hypothetical protein
MRMSEHREPAWVVATVRTLVRLRWLCVAIIAVLSAVSIYVSRRVQFDGSVEVWFLENDPDIVKYNEFREKFGQDEFVVVGLFRDQLFDRELLEALDEFTRHAETLTGVRKAMSLTNVPVLEREDRATKLAPLIPTLPQTDAECQALREKAVNHPLLTAGLINRQGTATCVVVTLNDEGRDADQQGRLVDQLHEASREMLESIPHPPRVRFAGTPVVNVGMFRFARKDLLSTVPIAVAMVVICSWLVFRNFLAPVVPLGIVLVATIWILGVMGWMEFKATI